MRNYNLGSLRLLVLILAFAPRPEVVTGFAIQPKAFLPAGAPRPLPLDNATFVAARALHLRGLWNPHAHFTYLIMSSAQFLESRVQPLRQHVFRPAPERNVLTVLESQATISSPELQLLDACVPSGSLPVRSGPVPAHNRTLRSALQQRRPTQALAGFVVTAKHELCQYKMPRFCY